MTHRLEYLRTDKLTWLSRGLSLCGLCLSSYLAWVYLHNQAPVCTITHGCATVARSHWARPMGIPMPVFGLLGYAALFVSACTRGERARTVGMVLTVFAIVISLTLTYLEINVIHAICIWCMASAVCAACHVVVNSTRYVRGEPALVRGLPGPAIVRQARG